MIEDKPNYYHVTDTNQSHHLEKTKKREERSSLKEIYNAWNDNIKNQQDVTKFIKAWEEIRPRIVEKKSSLIFTVLYWLSGKDKYFDKLDQLKNNEPLKDKNFDKLDQLKNNEPLKVQINKRLDEIKQNDPDFPEKKILAELKTYKGRVLENYKDLPHEQKECIYIPKEGQEGYGKIFLAKPISPDEENLNYFNYLVPLGINNRGIEETRDRNQELMQSTLQSIEERNNDLIDPYDLFVQFEKGKLAFDLQDSTNELQDSPNLDYRIFLTDDKPFKIKCAIKTETDVKIIDVPDNYSDNSKDLDDEIKKLVANAR